LVQRRVKQGTPVQNFNLLATTKVGERLAMNISILALPRNHGPWTVHVARVSRDGRLEQALREIQQALQSVHLDGHESRRWSESQRSGAAPHSRTTDRFPSLTRRELEVLELLLRGLSTSCISTQLHISLNTVRNHLQHLLTKTGTHNRSQLVLCVLHSRGY
jgi:DNA-binding NarL/FixJ family response regulator